MSRAMHHSPLSMNKGPLLLLGGTGDARHLAADLTARGITLIYSIAGLVRQPALDCEIFSGGFTQVGGLDAFVHDRRVSAILDATHPYAVRMSTQALASARACGLPCWRFQRPGWQAQIGDDWHLFSDWPQLLVALADKRSVFLSAGQPDQYSLTILADYQHRGQRQLLRTATEPSFTPPGTMRWHKATGPFALADELQLLRDHHIDAVVSKNSGGHATAAKLVAARSLGIPVFMLQRPALPDPDQLFHEPEAARQFVTCWFAPPTSLTALTPSATLTTQQKETL